MSPDEINSIFEVIDNLTTLGLMGVSVWALLTEKVVPKSRLDEQKDLTKEAIAGWREQTKNNERLADLWEARNEAEERARASK